MLGGKREGRGTAIDPGLHPSRSDLQRIGRRRRRMTTRRKLGAILLRCLNVCRSAVYNMVQIAFELFRWFPKTLWRSINTSIKSLTHHTHTSKLCLVSLQWDWVTQSVLSIPDSQAHGKLLQLLVSKMEEDRCNENKNINVTGVLSKKIS